MKRYYRFVPPIFPSDVIAFRNELGTYTHMLLYRSALNMEIPIIKRTKQGSYVGGLILKAGADLEKAEKAIYDLNRSTFRFLNFKLGVDDEEEKRGGNEMEVRKTRRVSPRQNLWI